MDSHDLWNHNSRNTYDSEVRCVGVEEMCPLRPRRYKNQCKSNVGPASETQAQYWMYIGCTMTDGLIHNYQLVWDLSIFVGTYKTLHHSSCLGDWYLLGLQNLLFPFDEYIMTNLMHWIPAWCHVVISVNWLKTCLGKRDSLYIHKRKRTRRYRAVQ